MKKVDNRFMKVPDSLLNQINNKLPDLIKEINVLCLRFHGCEDINMATRTYAVICHLYFETQNRVIDEVLDNMIHKEKATDEQCLAFINDVLTVMCYSLINNRNIDIKIILKEKTHEI